MGFVPVMSRISVLRLQTTSFSSTGICYSNKLFKSHLLTNDALCSLNGFLHLLPESDSSTFHHSWKNLFNSFGKGVWCKHRLHNIRALNLRFLLRKVTPFTV